MFILPDGSKPLMIHILHNNFGPNGVCPRPLGVAAERSVHYFLDYFSSSSVAHTFRDPPSLLWGL